MWDRVVMALALCRLAAALFVIAARPDPAAWCPDCADAADRAFDALQDAAPAFQR